MAADRQQHSGAAPPAEATTEGGALSAGALGNITKSASTAGRQTRRFALQNAARELLPDARVGFCMRVMRPDVNQVDVMLDAEHGAAHYKGLMTCGSVWVCPVCAARITERRRAELQGGLLAHPELVLVMVTVTFEHHRGEGLRDVLGALKAGLREGVRAGRDWMALKARLQLVGSVTATEITHGEGAGWHPHEHILLLCRADRDAIDLGEVQAHFRDRLQAWCARKGGGRWVHPEHGVDVRFADVNASSYVSKWDATAELAKSGVKEARGAHASPWGLLAAYEGGDERAGVLFREYADAVHGRRLLVYSKGLRELLGIGEDRTDEELAQVETAAAVVLVSLTREQWRCVLAYDVRGEVLEVARGGDPAAVWEFMSLFCESG